MVDSTASVVLVLCIIFFSYCNSFFSREVAIMGRECENNRTGFQFFFVSDVRTAYGIRKFRLFFFC